MKIKTVCERTGLSDRAIRLYIENGLLKPEKTENHTGRRSFDFSEEDIARLDRIAALRAAGFSIAQIKEIQESPASIPTVVAEVTEKQETELRRSEKVLSVLNTLEDDIGSFEELAELLTDQEAPELPKTPSEDDRMRLRYLIARFIEGAYSVAVIDGVVRTVILVALVLFGYYVKYDNGGGYLFSAGMWTDIAVVAAAAVIAVISAQFTLRDADAVNLSVKLFLTNLIVAAAVGLMFLVWLIARIILYPVRPIPNYETIHIAELWIGFIGVSALARVTALLPSVKWRRVIVIVTAILLAVVILAGAVYYALRPAIRYIREQNEIGSEALARLTLMPADAEIVDVSGYDLFSRSAVVTADGNCYFRGIATLTENYGINDIEAYEDRASGSLFGDGLDRFVQIYDGGDAVRIRLSASGGVIVTENNEIYVFANGQGRYETPAYFAKGYTDGYLYDKRTVYLLSENGDLCCSDIISSPEEITVIEKNITKFKWQMRTTVLPMMRRTYPM